MSSATNTLVRQRPPSAFPFLVMVLALSALSLVFIGWRWIDFQPRSTIPVLELGTRGDSMVFDRTELTARTGTMVRVVFRNNSRLVDMPHNWVLTQAGAEDAVAMAGAAAGPQSDYLRPNDPNVIAFTKLSGPGASSSVTFVAPPPGNYPYFCAFPGHHTVMKGTLLVTP